ncbi:MAG: hypothetical protein ACFFAY_11350 [Promethearchaeota archaeon]
MQELRDFLNHVIIAKRRLKEIYYTTRDSNVKADAKQLVVATITVQKSLEHLITLHRKSKIGKKVLEDRKASLTLRKWSIGLPKRVKNFVDKKKKMSPEHLRKFQENLLAYLEEIGVELTAWAEDIQTLSEIPRPPKE